LKAYQVISWFQKFAFSNYKLVPLQLGITCQKTDNPALRAYFGMLPHETGVLVTSVMTVCPSAGLIELDDLLLEVDGEVVANDGTVSFRGWERVAFDHLISLKKPGQAVELKVRRRVPAKAKAKAEAEAKTEAKVKIAAPRFNASILSLESIRPPATDDSRVVRRLHDILDEARLAGETTADVEKILKRLERDLDVALAGRERFIRDEIEKFVKVKEEEEEEEAGVPAGDAVESEVITVRVAVQPRESLVPVHQYDRLPSYYVFAGLLFSPLTQPLLHEWGDDWYNQAPRTLCSRALNDDQQVKNEEVVVLAQVLADEINAGYQGMQDVEVNQVDGKDIRSMRWGCTSVFLLQNVSAARRSMEIASS
jgi:hypothetical protein